MKSKIVKILLYSTLAVSLFLIGLILIPRKYNVSQFEKRSDTQYWELHTGSTIGYQRLIGDSTTNTTPIIYLHGGPGGRITNETIELLKPLNHDIYLYDQIGSGHSERLKDITEYTVDRHTKDLEAIIEVIQTPKVILMGQSWGALLAMEYVAKHPDKVEKLIFTGPGPILPFKTELTKIESPDSLNLKSPQYSNAQGNQAAYNLRTKFLFYGAALFGKKMSTDKEADNFFTYLNTQLNKSTKCDPADAKPSNGGGGYYVHVMTVRSFQEVKDKRAQVDGLEIPTLIIKGQCDNQKWGFTQEYLKLLPNSKLEIIEGAGHIIGKEHQEEYLQVVNAFLKNKTYVKESYY
ncbi:MAG: alpha/beta hydrolase [Bacteroidota bacterium]